MNDTKEIFNLFQEMQTYSGVAKHLGIDYRTVKRHVEKYHAENSFVESEATRTGIPFDRIRHYWLKTKNELGDDVSIFVKNSSEVMEYDEIRDALIKDLESFAPRVKLYERPLLPVEQQHLLVIDPADVHIGKLALEDETGENYNIQVALDRVYAGVSDILQKSIPFGIHQIVLVVGNDILHVDNTKRATTSGTPQDTDSQWWKMFEVARDMYVNIIEECKQYAPVTIMYCPSNHDKVLGFSLTDSLFSWYRNDENVDVSTYGKSMRHRKYLKYGSNLLGFTHGDGAKHKDLISLMQHEVREAWAGTNYAYWYTHHFHHKTRIINEQLVEKDYQGVTIVENGRREYTNVVNTQIECVRSPSSPDSWHSQYGYVNTTAIEAFIHHPQNGQVARITSHV